MKPPVASLVCLLSLLAGGTAAGQVTVNPHALDSQAPAAPTPPRPAARPPARPPARTHATPAKPAANPPAPAPAPAATPAAPPPDPMPSVPAAPPPAPVLPPPLVVPTRPAPPPPPATITADAPGESSAIPGGLRITFGPGRSDLNPASAGAIRNLADGNKARPEITYTVMTYAAVSADDNSAARRLSLARGLAIRSLLMGEGITSPRIYVRALGGAASANPPAPDLPPDRADIIIGSIGTEPPAAPQARPAP